jgi:hypothetical protein
MHKGFIIIKLESLISDRTNQIKSTPPEEIFLLSKGCRSGVGEVQHTIFQERFPTYVAWYLS